MKLFDDEKMASLAKEFFSKVKGDDGLQQLFKDYDQDRIQHHPQTFYSRSFGEGTYTSMEIEEAHKNISINDNHFNSMVNHFVQTLDAHGYGEDEKAKAIEALKGYKNSVLGGS